MKTIISLVLIIFLLACKKKDATPIVESGTTCKPKTSEFISGKYVSNTDTIQIIYSSTKCDDSNYNYYIVKQLYKLYPKRIRDYTIEVDESKKGSTQYIDSVLIGKGTQDAADYFIFSEGDKKYYKLKKL